VARRRPAASRLLIRNQHMSKRIDITGRVFGVLNLAFGLFGFCDQMDTIIHFKHAINTTKTPFFVESFYAMSSINLVFAFCLVFSGYFLLRGSAKAIHAALFIFAAEIAYLVSIIPISTSDRLGFSVASAVGIGNVALTAQMLGAYPLTGLIILSWVNRSRSRSALDSPGG
jgi:hypothetical protein